MRIIGIDPGLNITGYGIIEASGEGCRFVACGVVRTKPSASMADRLTVIRDGVRETASQSGAAVSAIESSFVGENARSALLLGHARAAAILGLADAGLTVAEYTPALVKQTVTGYGRGEKSQVAHMVRIQLGLPETPTPADAADALAVAITHWAHTRLGA